MYIKTENYEIEILKLKLHMTLFCAYFWLLRNWLHSDYFLLSVIRIVSGLDNVYNAQHYKLTKHYNTYNESICVFYCAKHSIPHHFRIRRCKEFLSST